MSDSEVKAYLLLKEDIRKLLIEILRIGNNINQIAHEANSMYLTKEDIEVINLRKLE
ncbi:MAG: plasmid mobilization relaxosome protein MobC [Lachnospiraceae bacterium]|nr:plasmid mobilization relaxosome protein MobC [Lachnospiraceae bacterium]